eukprot:scaffold208085_cov18-Prasinocladus_malaysianus.AAC.1
MTVGGIYRVTIVILGWQEAQDTLRYANDAKDVKEKQSHQLKVACNHAGTIRDWVLSHEL